MTTLGQLFELIGKGKLDQLEKGYAHAAWGAADVIMNSNPDEHDREAATHAYAFLHNKSRRALYLSRVVDAKRGVLRAKNDMETNHPRDATPLPRDPDVLARADEYIKRGKAAAAAKMAKGAGP